MANPRKFSEKIALQKQRQQEGTAEFERIMKEVYATKMDETQANQKILECCLVNTDIGSNRATNAGLISAAGVGGGGGNGNGGGGGGGGGGVSSTGDGSGSNGPVTNSVGSGSGGTSPDGSGANTIRESRGRSVGVGPMRRPSERKQDRSPYGSNAGVAVGMSAAMSNNAYLSPPMDSSWRRSNSDSALHQTLNMAVAAEGGFGPGGMVGMSGLPGDMNALHANYQHHNQRSHSPNIGRSFSPQAQRRKGQMLHHQQQQQQHAQQLLHHSQQQLHLQQQHQQLQQQFQQQQQQQQQQHMHQQAQQQHVQQHHTQQPVSSVSQQQQHAQQFNAKYTNCNMPINSLFKSLQEQSLANTGSLPDLTSLHYAPAQQQLIQQVQQQQQQQQTLSPVLSPHNNGRDRDQSSSPFSPAGANGGNGGGGGGGGGGGPHSPYQQQQHSPTSAANTPTAAQTSPHLSFTNLAVQSPTGSGPATQNTAQTGNFTNLPTLGAASSTGNLTDYRQPLNPPSPGSSPGLLTSVSGNEVVHISAPASPIRHPQGGMIGQGMQGYNEENVQAFDRYAPAMAAAIEASGYNSLNPSFHNHFKQFTLGDSNSSPEQQQQLQSHYLQHQQQQRQQHQQSQNNFTALDFDDFVSAGNGSQYPQSLSQSKQLDFSDLTGVSTATTTTQSSRGSGDGGGTCNSNNVSNTPHNNNSNTQHRQQQQVSRILAHQLLNNNGAGGGSNVSGNTNSNGPCHISTNNVNLTQANEVNSSPIPSPLGCLPSPSSPLPIPISAQSPHHQHQQMSLSLHSHSAQPSPHHSPMHSPHHASPLSSSSPGITTLAGGVSPTPHGSSSGTNNASTHQHQQTTQHLQQQHQQQQHHHQQNHANTPTNTNIPAIIFSDYSSREIFDSLDLDLGQMDETALDLLADQNSIMIADPTIEDSFRKDLN